MCSTPTPAAAALGPELAWRGGSIEKGPFLNQESGIFQSRVWD